MTSNKGTIIFIIILCLFSASILSLVATLLQRPQQKAREFDSVKQLLIATKILSYDNYFLLPNAEGVFMPAIYDKEKKCLVFGEALASKQDIMTVYQQRVKPMLVTDSGSVVTFLEANLQLNTYLETSAVYGYANLPYKLIYFIMGNHSEDTLPFAYVIPINGYGLWGPIYGYLAIENNADIVLGTTWYDQKETAGLGAVIATQDWQRQFYKKRIFQPSDQDQTNFQRAPLGLTVVKGKVQQVYAHSPKAFSAIDGIPGATLTGNGVTAAYHDCLAPYRPFLIQAHNRYLKENTKS